MAKPAARIAALQVLLALGGLAVFVRGVIVQVVQHKAWHERVTTQRTSERAIPARRGTIRDRNGKPLASTQELYRLVITTAQMKDTARVRKLLLAAGNSREKIDRELSKKFGYFGDLLNAEELEPFRNLPGVYFETEQRRIYPLGSLAIAWLGSIDAKARATGGIESAFDSALTGVPGREKFLKDNLNKELSEVPGARLLEPVPGRDVYLTIDSELQGIVEGELKSEIVDRSAKGGDIVVLDIHTGEVLAIASFRRDSATQEIVPRTSAVVEPNEPGSTSKIFTAAAMLRYQKDTDAVQGFGGVYVVPGTDRKIFDVHAENGPMSLGETIKVSSNVAISQFSLRLSPVEQYTALRDFGFGTPSAIGLAGEAKGTLYHPPWNTPDLSRPSVAQGYEWMATALQLASGYAAIANGGVLMAPSLVSEVRGTGGQAATWHHEPTTVRRAITNEVATRLREYLKLATDSGGSGSKAQLDRYTVIGKTGTAKLPPYDGRAYRASFAGLFPGDDPQVVIYVMIDRPSGGEIFGGQIAAPLVRRILLQALAVETSPLDRSRMESRVSTVATAPRRQPGSDSVRSVTLPLRARATIDTAGLLVPELKGLSTREAVAALHQLGLRVQLSGIGQVTNISPAAGVTVTKGSLIILTASITP